MSKLPTPSEILGQSFHFLPQESQLLLITSVLGTSPSWLTYSLLHHSLTNGENVVFVSFINEFSYFREGAKRHGLDLPSHLKKGTLTFIDGFSKLFLPSAPSQTPSLPPTASAPPRVGVIPSRGGPIAPRQVPQQPQPATASTDPIKYVSLGPSPSSSALRQLDVIKSTLQKFDSNGAKPKLVIEGLEVLIAAAGVDVRVAEDLVYDLREISSTTTILLPSDSVLLQTSASSTPLELSHANLVISLGHTADAILSLRLLDTGVAKDISGVLKVTRGAGNLGETGGIVEEKEMLYYESDAGVRIFARGSGGH
ncbi:hypothetical protein TWF106_007192 [Orbilia oligospora]|uniref:Elongator complex protein 6 n=1 Tax=Orbilia oligospora TaxID=2813651 RepID=A0A6G1MLU0_ORBOL|nr:hypothetical protein TWF788_000436 [Orbilia oligospora]KAF3202542.1 hypothetical protein TWF679_010787 [Orbilia oligospora]KAF3214077.1 hypothetical protein TWF191_009898 [Orbilia oligospora]KAF3219078.1 hypothetical protein TWF106_007192 [Orbilia oligospora]KAF3263558.1 hypothetical protein TWF192_005837 [Orbilia oligospora]